MNKKKLSVKEILARSHYVFQGNVVKAVLGNGYEKFVEQYCEQRGSHVHKFVPSDLQMKVFDKIQRGELTVDDWTKTFGCATLAKTYYQLGKMYAYIQRNKSNPVPGKKRGRPRKVVPDNQG